MPKPLVIITGASSGIGAAIAKRFSEAGYPLLLLARRLENLEALKLPNTISAQVDVRDKEALKKAIDNAEKTYGPADCLINNAGLMQLGAISDQNPDEWQNMFDINVVALLNGMQAVLGSMKSRKTGTIINISSTAGRKTFTAHAAYCGTKFAVHAISESVREEMASDNVRVITIAPGVTESELLGHTNNDKIIENYLEWKDSIGGAIAADDVARSVIFAYEQPQSVCIREIVIAPTRQQP